MPSLLIADKEKDIFFLFERLFKGDQMEMTFADNGKEAVHLALQGKPDVVLLSVQLLGEMDGFEALRRIKANRSKQLVVIMSSYGTTQTAIEAMKLGAFDYLIKPFDVNQVREVLTAAIKANQDMQNVVSYQPLLKAEEYDESIIGQSAPMQQVYKQIGQVAASEASVLITGESGTGKELVARAIYHHSLRRTKPFLALHCAAIPENLLESELFGYEKGAFTGALNRKLGKIEMCDHGTIMLDEIGDMPLSAQTKVLRILQDGTFERVGGTQTIQVDVRFLAATNQSLETAIHQGSFREDLFYRLNVFPIHLPPLRDRLEDIPMLCEYFLNKIMTEAPQAAHKISTEAVESLQNYGWPGNIRELENVIKNAALKAAGKTILSNDLMIFQSTSPILAMPGYTRPSSMPAAAPSRPAAPFNQTPNPEAAPQASDMDSLLDPVFDLIRSRNFDKMNFKPFDEIERSLLVKALNETGGNQVRAAKLLGINRTTLRKRMEKYQVKVETQITLN